MNIPDAEEFSKLQVLPKSYVENHKIYISPLVKNFIINFHDIDIQSFIEDHEQARLKVFNETLSVNSECIAVLDWFDNQPPFMSVFGKAKEKCLLDQKELLIQWLCYRLTFYYLLDTEVLPEKLEKQKRILGKISVDDMTEEDRKNSYNFWSQQTSYIKQLIKDRKPKFSIEAINDLKNRFKKENIVLSEHIELEKLSDKYLASYTLKKLGVYQAANFEYINFMSEFGRMAYWYLTNTYLEKITVSKDRLNKIIELLSEVHNEVDTMLNSKWFPQSLRMLTLPYGDFRSGKRRAIGELRKIQKEELSIVKRKDQTVQERLMIVDLIRTHKRILDFDIDKRALYKLMELPFINNLIEMKTIERIIKSERKNQESD